MSTLLEPPSWESMLLPAERTSGDPPPVLTVGELDRTIKRLLEGSFSGPLWVEGEVTGFRPAASGHLYFSLKDEQEDASIDTVMYKTSATQKVRALLGEGARVRLRGRPTFWPPRGRLQFVADRAEPAGRGALLEALETLKAMLMQEGLFAPERKRPLPEDPRVIGVVTSAQGAVIHDICKVAFRRGGARLLLAPAVVQGAGAAESIRRALAMLVQVAGVDVVILGRGGGSADDLSAFNDEGVVRAVATCPVPVVSAVGHEVDVTLVDFAADVRAATPSQAAELTVPDGHARRGRVNEGLVRLSRAAQSRVMREHVLLASILRRLGDPRLALASFQQKLDDCNARMESALSGVLRRKRELWMRGSHRLAGLHPRVGLARDKAHLLRVTDRLSVRLREGMATRRSSLAGLTGRLDALSPLRVLGRGYAIAVGKQGKAIRSIADVIPGERFWLRVQHGRLAADVVSVEAEPDSAG